ncbi:MAG: hypothetical protein U9Q62_04840 [Campylobacterota bacterium]|nr:hypothetical protein [Campylobacterota bacterium]
MILLANEVIIFLFVEGLLLLLQSIAFINAISILSRWNFTSFSALQYRLEKRAYLVVLIILFTLGFKIVMLPFFSYTIDQLSVIVPGAMCGAGVISANEYGPVLLFLKVMILFLIGSWLILNNEDIKASSYPYFKAKLWLFLLIYLLVVTESVLDILYLTNIPIDDPVSCCSTIYGIAGGGDPLPFSLDTARLLMLFYLIYALILATNYFRYTYINLVANLFFLYIAYHAVVYFFGTYVYELPTHQCPFCMLQKEYFYVGYFIWGSLFLGAFFGIAGAILKGIMRKEVDFVYGASALFNTIFVLLCSLYVAVYYLKTGVFL